MKIGKTSGGFHLDQNTGFLRTTVQVVGDLIPARSTRQRAAHASDARRWIASGRDDALRLLGGLDHRDQQGLCPDVKILFDERRITRGGADHGVRSEEHRLNSSHSQISYAVFCLKKKKQKITHNDIITKK